MTSDDDLCARVDRLEQRLRSVDDELEITRTVVEYGLAVDSGEAEATGQLSPEDTVFDVDGDNIMRGRPAVEAMVLGRGISRSCRTVRTRSAPSWCRPMATRLWPRGTRASTARPATRSSCFGSDAI